MREHAFAVGQTNYKGVSGANWGADASQGLGPADTGAVWVNVGTNGSYDGLSDGDGLMFRTDYRARRRHADVVDGLSQTLMIGEALPSVDGYCSWPYANNAYSTCAIPPNCEPPSDPHDWAQAQSFRSTHPGGSSSLSLMAECSLFTTLLDCPSTADWHDSGNGIHSIRTLNVSGPTLSRVTPGLDSSESGSLNTVKSWNVK